MQTRKALKHYQLQTIVAVSVFAWLSSNEVAQWTVTNLHPAGATWSNAYAASGLQQAGFADVGGITRASLWSGTAASWVDLSPAGATYSVATATNGSQQAGLATVGGIDRASLSRVCAATDKKLPPSKRPIYNTQPRSWNWTENQPIGVARERPCWGPANVSSWKFLANDGRTETSLQKTYTPIHKRKSKNLFAQRTLTQKL